MRSRRSLPASERTGAHAGRCARARRSFPMGQAWEDLVPWRRSSRPAPPDCPLPWVAGRARLWSALRPPPASPAHDRQRRSASSSAWRKSKRGGGGSRGPYWGVLHHQMPRRLPADRPAQLPVLIDDEVLLLRDTNRLVVPLGNRRRDLQLRRKPHAGDHLRITATRHAFLIVPQTDQRARAMAVHPDRVRIHGAVHLLGLHLRQCRCEDFVAAATGARFLEEDVL